MIDIKSSRLFKSNYYKKAFLTGLVLAFIMFIPFIIKDGGRFLFYGDFNVQQVPFYQLAHDAIRNGDIGWSQYTDLGANFVGSYSFYLLGSPFFWLTIPFPSEAVQFLMGPLLMLKFAFATLAAFTFLQRYVSNKNVAILGGLLYAFSGFSVYNVFFNHFHEALIIFPFLLASIDEYIATRRRGIVALCVCFACVFNYYFFVGQVVFCVIYFIVRIVLGSYKISLRDFLLLALECIIGLAMSCLLLIPSILVVIQNSRANDPIMGWNALLYDIEQRYLHIAQSMFFPPDLPARANFTPDSKSNWASLGTWLPLFGMTGTIAWLQQRRKHWVKRLLGVLFVFALVPGLNASFQLFNANYYARWYYMLTLILVLATVMSIESVKVDWKRAIKWNAYIVGFIAVAIAFVPHTEEVDDKDELVFGLMKYPTRFWSYVAISLLCIAFLVYLFNFVPREKLMKNAMIGTSITCVLYGMFFIALGKTQSLDPYTHIIPNALNGGSKIDLEDIQESRSDFYESLDNSGMYWQVPTIQAFHSLVPGSIMEFYDYIGVPRDVGSRPTVSHLALRGITSVKWLFDDEDDDNYFAGEDYDRPLMYGFNFYGNANGFDIWENENYIPMGFSYDYYMIESETEELSEATREKLMLQAAIIPDEDEEIWSKYMTSFGNRGVDYSNEAYAQNCKDRAETACTEFDYTKTGFVATHNSEKSQIVFFSVPYEKGWSAKVNGEETEILKTNIGFMSVQVPQGQSTKIEFTFKTPGLNMGLIVTLIGIGLLVLYVIYGNKINKKDIERAKRRKSRKRKVGSFAEYCKQMKIELPTHK